MNSSTLTVRALGRNHTVWTAGETGTKAFLYWNKRILLFRSSSEMFVHLHWERCEKHSLSIIVTKRESTRQHEASRNPRAAQVSREVAKRMTNKFSAKHVKIVAFPYCRATLRAMTSDRPDPTEICHVFFEKTVLRSRKTASKIFGRTVSV